MSSAAFMGTPAAAIPIMDAVADVAELRLVVTRPDRARGRSSAPVPPPVAVAAGERGLEVSQPETARHLYEVVESANVDVVVVAAYGRLIRADLLAVPRCGFVNVHFSLLPRWRGASPVARAILAGDDVTGVSLMVMDEGLDTGPVLEAVEVEIRRGDTAGTLTDRLASLGGEMVRGSLPSYLDGALEPMPQDDMLATAAARIETTEAFVDPVLHSTSAIDRAIRAFDPRPGAWGIVDGERIKLWKAAPVSGDGPDPGVARRRSDGVFLGTADGAIELIEVQPAGKPRMAAVSWMNGRRGEPARFSRP